MTGISRNRKTVEELRRLVVGIDQKMPLLDGTEVPYINFDNAASTPTVNPVHFIAGETHKYGAEIAVDAAQVIPHRKVDMRGGADGEQLDYLSLENYFSI